MVVKYFVLVAVLLFVEVQTIDLIDLPEFIAGRPEIPRRGRAVRAASAVCDGPTKAAKTFCDSALQCEATKVFVRISWFYLRISK